MLVSVSDKIGARSGALDRRRSGGTGGVDAARRIAEEGAVAQSVLEGNRDHFRHLVTRYQGSLISTLYRLVQSREEAEELAQQTFVDAFDALARFDQSRRFSTWLFRIGINNAKDWLKSSKRGERQLDGCVAADGAAFAGRMTAPDRAAEASEQRDRLRGALGELKLEFREVIVLKDIQGLSYDEIHEVLGYPITTLKIRAVRGRAALRELLERESER